jgi:hypothetical protein
MQVRAKLARFVENKRAIRRDTGGGVNQSVGEIVIGKR